MEGAIKSEQTAIKIEAVTEIDSPDIKEEQTAIKIETVAKIASPEGTNMKKRNKGSRKYSQLVIDAIRTLGEKNGSSLCKIHKEAKKESWFDQQNGRMFLRYSLRALVLNGTLVQVKGLGANGSFKLNRNKFEAKSKNGPSKPAEEPKPIKKLTKDAKEKDKKKESLKTAKTSAARKSTPKNLSKEKIGKPKN